ncbi:hypothetical protein Xen7305DRAFT_00048760 [Xenococcus sp. PCC 7305]|nr:hypothetical protein Xen7305DRAFT_00048760 [Xenococcus sp. PCC 7305]
MPQTVLAEVAYLVGREAGIKNIAVMLSFFCHEDKI